VEIGNLPFFYQVKIVPKELFRNGKWLDFSNSVTRR